MYETDSSIASGSFTDQEELSRFLNRCSICFDAPLDFCLNYCKDQYCIDCFQKYITEVVKSSWGLSVTPIKCPVCRELIPKYEWSRYVPRKLIEIYDKFNKPYRSFVRACSHCETEITPCTYQPSTLYQPGRIICDMIEGMLHSCPEGQSHKTHANHISIKQWISIYKKQDWYDSKLPSLYRRTMSDVIQFEKSHIRANSRQQYAYNISLQFLNLHVRPEVWKQIQFTHISFFPNMSCPKCKITICLHCGNDSHCDLTCEDNMKKMIATTLISQEIRDSMIWKLKNSQRCPSCSIMINRDEGCNKVDCSYCGFSFCWACKSSWAEGCGFYRCSNSLDNNDSILDNYNLYSEEQTEAGVPNMSDIQARLTMSYFTSNDSHFGELNE